MNTITVAGTLCGSTLRLPPMFALTLPTELRWEVETTGRTWVFSAFELVAVHPAYKTFDAGLDITEERLNRLSDLKADLTRVQNASSH